MSTSDTHSSSAAIRFLRRVRLTLEMTWDYSGRFPRRKVLGLYWRQAGRMVNGG